jgi:lysophospholipase L1-like esterase
MSMSLSLSLGITNQLSIGGGAALPIPLPATVASVVGFGDSITVGQQASDAAHQWLNIVSTAMSAGTPLNAGIAGTVLQNSNDSGGSPRANNGRDRYISALTGSNTREMVFVAYGFNDARYTAAPATLNVANYTIDLREVVLGLLGAGYPQDRICIVSPYWISDTGLNTGSAGFTGQTRVGFEAYVTAAASIATQYGLYYANVYAAMRDNGGASLIYTDDIHPIDAGHAVIAAAVLAATRVAVTLPTYSEFMVDTFTDSDGTLITQHSGDKLALWSLQTGSAPATQATINGNRAWATASTDVYRNRFAAPSADYYVEGVFDYLTTVASDNLAVTGRADGAAATYYWFGYSRASLGWRLFKTVATVNTQLGSTVAFDFTSGSKTVRLEMQGTTIRGVVDGATVISVTDSGIPPAAGPGAPGVRLAVVQTATTGIQLNSVKAGIL